MTGIGRILFLVLTLSCSVASAGRAASIQTLSARPDVPEGLPLPLCIVLPGGPGRMPQATGVMSLLGNPLAERGWSVVVPVSPDGASFFGDAAEQVVAVMDTLQGDRGVRPGKVLLAGVSNGGIAALQVASMIPGRVSGVIAVPGMLHSRVALARLANLPVYFRVGADDPLEWGKQYDAVTRAMRQAGVRLDAKRLSGVGHGIPIDWEEIDAWIARELGALAPAPVREVSVSLPAAAGRLRTWTSRNGDTVEAALTEVRPREILLMNRDGQTLRVPKKKLSEEDRTFIQQQVTAADGNP
jgi:predicted esterase